MHIVGEQILDVQIIDRDGCPNWLTMPMSELLELSASFRAGGGGGASIVQIQPSIEAELDEQYAAYQATIADCPELIEA